MDLYSCNDVNEYADILTKKLVDIFDVMAPIRTIQIKSGYAPWVSDRSKELIRLRNSAQKVASISKSPEDWRFYKSLRNQAKARMRYDRKEWARAKLCSGNHDSRTLWNNLKTWLNWSSSGPPTKLLDNGTLISSPVKLAEKMNSFFRR